jgi:small subunit ribosomal protein S16
MAVRIRLSRTGNRNNPFYRIVVANQKNPTDGKAIEFLGTYDPKGGGQAVLKKERYNYWIGVGAIPSDTVRSLVPRAIEHADTLPAPVVAETTEESTEEAPVEKVAAPVAE